MLLFLFSFFFSFKIHLQEKGEPKYQVSFFIFGYLHEGGKTLQKDQASFFFKQYLQEERISRHQVSCFLLKNIYKRREDPKHQVSFFSICNRREEPVYQASICHQACVHCPMCILVHAFIAIASIQKTLLTYSLNFAIFFVKFCFRSWEPYLLSQKS